MKININVDLLVLSLFFAALKLMSVIDWSWWLVLLPIWFIPSAIIFVVLIAFVFRLMGFFIKKIKSVNIT